ncbi:solute carrier family 35 member B1-like [Xenia sp. Carnegie-2017]|uniref:solute carrier family 35 member B1-like n=1 Tax=Xenia sp. Carnegie-2017 TaxID=2897299 RepID=UPI001F03E79D|nr:solute carrier family 35 member B1-like [Xenia sp. Carnegie-2017]
MAVNDNSVYLNISGVEENKNEGQVNESMSNLPTQSRKKLIICCSGIFICYFYYGIIQERITRFPYGEEKEKFVYPMTLVFIQCIVNSLFATAVIKFTYYGSERDTTPNTLYIWCAFSYVGAMLASNAALQFINYPTQVLGKSAKPIPVMILGVLIAKKKYPLVKYLFVLMIVCGVALFLYKDKKQKTDQHSDMMIGFGEILLLVSLTLDGMTGATQDKMRTEHHIKSHHMMQKINICSFLILGTGIVFTGEIWKSIAFCQRHPSVLPNMLSFSIASALGQNFIFITVATFGPLTCSIVTTTRKFFTILASVIYYGNALVSRQWIGVVLVFAGLSLDSMFGKTRK